MAGLGLVLTCAVTTFSQSSLSEERPTLRYNPLLLIDPAVQQDLKLSSKGSRAILVAMAAEENRLMAKVKKHSPAKDIAYYDLTIAHAVQKLSPFQRERLHQITLQSYGAFALFDAQVANEVGLTRAQRQAFATYVSKHAHNLGEALDDPKASATDAEAAEIRSRQQSQATLQAILTAKQRDRWNSLLGKPVHLTPLSKLTAIPH